MSSPSTLMILFFMIPLLFTATATTIFSSTAATTYTTATRQLPSYPEYLENYILPWILHSTRLKAYTLNKDTGEFTITLHRNTLRISLYDTYLIYFKYKSTIKGVMNKEMSNVTNLEGISEKLGSVWVDVKDIKWTINDDERFGIDFSWETYPVNYEKLLRDHQGFWSKVIEFVKEKIMKMQLSELPGTLNQIMIKWGLIF